MNKTTQLFAGAALGVAFLIGIGAVTYHNDAVSTGDLTVTGNLIFGGQTNTSFPAGGIAGTIITNGVAASAGQIAKFTSSTNQGPASSSDIQTALGINLPIIIDTSTGAVTYALTPITGTFIKSGIANPLYLTGNGATNTINGNQIWIKTTYIGSTWYLTY